MTKANNVVLMLRPKIIDDSQSIHVRAAYGPPQNAGANLARNPPRFNFQQATRFFRLSRNLRLFPGHRVGDFLSHLTQLELSILHGPGALMLSERVSLAARPAQSVF